MSDHDSKPRTQPEPAAETDRDMHKVDEKVQEDAAKERAENGGYD